MKSIIWIIVIAIIVVGLILFTGNSEEEFQGEDIVVMMDKAEVTEDAMVKEVNDEMKESMMIMPYQYSGTLDDVTGGEDVRGINTGGVASGLAQASFEDETYSLLVSFENLPDPVGTDFYEGWAVRRGDSFDVLSVGKVSKVDGSYMNLYSSGENLLDHDFYVLTIEPDDGDPAPADHIVEGTLFEL